MRAELVLSRKKNQVLHDIPRSAVTFERLAMAHAARLGRIPVRFDEHERCARHYSACVTEHVLPTQTGRRGPTP
jgi:hypothetical protein